MYIINFEAENPSIALYRGIFSVPGHMLFAVTMGYYISLSKFAPTFALMRSYKIKSLLYPVLLHGTFNFILSLNIHWLFAFVPFVIFLWIFNIKKLRTFSKESRYYKNLYDSNNYNNRN
jgi:RsiW-degrading membrane proteinase PrsW (M82 family)